MVDNWIINALITCGTHLLYLLYKYLKTVTSVLKIVFQLFYINKYYQEYLINMCFLKLL